MATEFNDRFDTQANEGSPSAEGSEKPDRSNWPTRIGRLSDQGEDADVLAMTPAERMEMMWPLAVNAWAFKGEDVSGSRLQRHVVRVKRRGS